MSTTSRSVTYKLYFYLDRKLPSHRLDPLQSQSVSLVRPVLRWGQLTAPARRHRHCHYNNHCTRITAPARQHLLSPQTMLYWYWRSLRWWWLVDIVSATLSGGITAPARWHHHPSVEHSSPCLWVSVVYVFCKEGPNMVCTPTNHNSQLTQLTTSHNSKLVLVG